MLVSTDERLNVLGDAAVKLGTAVAKKPEGGSAPIRLLKVERRDQNSGLIRPEFGEHVAALVADEAVAIKTLALLGADPVRRDHRHDVRDRMADHGPAPHPAG